jgi:hypothetical protein
MFFFVNDDDDSDPVPVPLPPDNTTVITGLMPSVTPVEPIEVELPARSLIEPERATTGVSFEFKFAASVM